MSQQINLFNPLFRKKGFSFTSATAMLCGVAVVAACAASVAVYQRLELNGATARSQAVEQAVKDTTARFDKLTADVAQQKPNAELEAEVAKTELQLKGRQEIMETLKSGTIGNTDGFSEFMRAFSRQSVNGLWMTGFDLARGGNEIAIQGRTLTADLVATYINQLNREKSLQGMQFSALRIRQPAADPADATKGAADSKGDAPVQVQKEAKGAPSGYLEFTVSTGVIADDAAQPGKPAQARGLLPAVSEQNANDGGRPAVRREAAR